MMSIRLTKRPGQTEEQTHTGISRKFSSTIILAAIVVILMIGRAPAQAEVVDCAFNPPVDALLSQSNIGSWLHWVEVLSGEHPAELDGFPYSIRTRNTRFLFDGSPDARGYDYVLLQVKNWFLDRAIIEQSFEYGQQDAKNIIVTIPGSTKPDEYVLLVAHLDDTSWNSIGGRIAPGANDNAIGAATLLEAARLFRQMQFERSIRLIWFTGEEAGTVGSRAYVRDYGNPDYRGVINLDMFGWDGDGDRCFEMHVGSLVESNEIGSCMAETIASYPHDLKYDYLNANATSRSDHINFWLKDIGAIAVSENFSEAGTEDGCVGADMNPYYHMMEDTIDLNLTPDFAFDIARAAWETTASLAVPVTPIQNPTGPTLRILDYQPDRVSLTWTSVASVQSYRVFRSSFGCQHWGVKVAETEDSTWTDEGIKEEWPYQYRVEAVFSDGNRVSKPSNCVSIGPEPPPSYHTFYFPMISR
jgi:leucyl aminopeptidase